MGGRRCPTSIGRMAVSPEQLRSLRFDEGLRGYDKRQVDKVIARVADLVEELQNHLHDAESRAAAAEARAAAPARPASAEAAELDETLRRTLILAQKTADAAIKEAREEAAQIRGQAQSEAEAMVAGARQRADELNAEADQHRRQAMADAEAERVRLVTEARQHCEERVAAVEAELAQTHEARRQELLDQIGQLTEVRNLLADDVELLEDHLGRRRAQIGAAVAEVAALLEDPAKLQVVPPPELNPIEVPELSATDDGSIQVGALDELVVQGEGAPAPGDAPEPMADALVDDAGPATELHPVVTDEPETDEPEGWPSLVPAAGEPSEEPARPAWADAVPPAQEPGHTDPFLDELRRASGGGDAEAEAMDRFFNEAEDERRSGWFRRKA